MNPLDLKPCHLTDLPIELHLQIFSNLQPYDILQARQACHSLYIASLERTVWKDALHRICVENTLFEPSFPIASMSLLELERASMGPRRWIARSSSKERTLDGVLPHLAMRRLILPTIDGLFVGDPESLESVYLVPGGRYLFSFSKNWMGLWDLGSPYSSGKEPHVIATASVVFFGLYLVHSTPDGLGLRIFIPYPIPYNTESFFAYEIYEIYPESTSPQIAQIAHTHVPTSSSSLIFYSLSYDRLIFLHGNMLTVWDYKANTWGRWSFEGDYCQILITRSTLTLIRTYGVSVWKIPPLLPESSLSTSTNPSIMAPAFELKYPDGQVYHHFLQAPCDWYSGSPQPLYYDLIENQDRDDDPLKISRFEVVINSQTSGATLNLLRTFEITWDDGTQFSEVTRICQDQNVTICIDDDHTGFIGSHVSDIYDHQQLPLLVTPLFFHPLRNLGTLNNVSFCPVAGRVVCCETDDWLSGITILDY
ncbi:hypothetical protein BYT27DRAFT_7173508 [Phlegmacium glaucopus]|nr:hypothetical protein BYT27DRAFT_7173508 [Phlegmacium glaucopus]